MNDFLSKIMTTRLFRVQEAEAKIGFPEVKRLAAEAISRRAEAGDARIFIPRPKTEAGIIAEIKKASPSKGRISPDANVHEIAEKYTLGGAAAISVLTEPDFFLGSDADMIAARKASAVPVLRKDFIVTEYQIYESAMLGADLMLLIARLLDAAQLQEYVALARELRLEPLVEIFDESDLNSFLGCGATLVGINNRDLKTFATDVNRSLEMVKFLEPGQIPIIASAIRTPEEIQFYTRHGVNHFLVGESLMRSKDPAGELRQLRGV